MERYSCVFNNKNKTRITSVVSLGRFRKRRVQLSELEFYRIMHYNTTKKILKYTPLIYFKNKNTLDFKRRFFIELF